MKQFSKSAFENADDETRAKLAASLASALAARLQDAPDFHGRVKMLVEDLRAIGHDLWSFDESDEFEAWCPDYHGPSGPGIVVTFAREHVKVEWSKR